MVDEQRANAYCIEDISKIENYDKAMMDDTHIWICHHKLEIHKDYRNTVKDLKMMNLYYHRPASELIFLTTEEHTSIHHKGKTAIPWNKGLTGKNYINHFKNGIKNQFTKSKDGGN